MHRVRSSVAKDVENLVDIVVDDDGGVRVSGRFDPVNAEVVAEELLIVAMIGDRRVRVFELVPREDADDAFVAADDALLDQFLRAGDARGGRGLAPKAVRADLRLRVNDFLIRNLANDAVAEVERTETFRQVDGAIDLDRAGNRVGAAIFAWSTRPPFQRNPSPL